MTTTKEPNQASPEAESSGVSSGRVGSSPLLGAVPPLDIYGLSFRLLAIADDDQEDDWLRDVCRQSGEMLANLTNVVTTEHETKADFIARVRAIIAMPNPQAEPRGE